MHECGGVWRYSKQTPLSMGIASIFMSLRRVFTVVMTRACDGEFAIRLVCSRQSAPCEAVSQKVWRWTASRNLWVAVKDAEGDGSSSVAVGRAVMPKGPW